MPIDYKNLGKRKRLKIARRLFVIFGAAIFMLLIIPLIKIYIFKPGRLEVDYLNIGQGDSELIKTPNHKLVLIDGGPDNLVLDRLGEVLPFYRRKIDYLILSHYHDDHATGLLEVIKRYQVKNLIYSNKRQSELLTDLLKVAQDNKVRITPLANSAKIDLEKACFINIFNPESLKIKKGIFILAVPDNQIRLTAEIISKLKIDFHNSLIIHLSGSHDISLLKSVALKKAHTASFHIMQTFPSRRKRNIKNSFAAIETFSNEASDYLFKFSKDLKLNPFLINSGNKAIYHLAAVFASNFINAVLFQSQQLFELLGLKGISFNDIFEPLYSSTLKNIKITSPARALSGPIERGDLETIKKHISEIKRISGVNPDILSSYVSLSLSLIDATAIKSGKLSRRHIEINDFLKK